MLTLSRKLLTFLFWGAATTGIAAGVVLAAVALSPDAVTVSSRLDPEVPRDAALRAARIGSFGCMVIAALLMPSLSVLRRVVDTAITGDPFVPENARRLRKLAGFVFGLDVVTHVMAMAMVQILRVEGGPLGLPFSLTGLLMVTMTLVLALIFEHGTRLRADVQGTV